MKGASYDVRKADPFKPAQAFGILDPGTPPVVTRARLLGGNADPVIAIFPKAPGLPKDKDAYLKFVEDIYKSDAYHSLSIEGYSVTPELIEKVKAGDWNPQENEADRQNRDALAARGYWQAFQNVKETVSQIIAGASRGLFPHRAPRLVPRALPAIDRCRPDTPGNACRLPAASRVFERLAPRCNRSGTSLPGCDETYSIFSKPRVSLLCVRS